MGLILWSSWSTKLEAANYKWPSLVLSSQLQDSLMSIKFQRLNLYVFGFQLFSCCTTKPDLVISICWPPKPGRYLAQLLDMVAYSKTIPTANNFCDGASRLIKLVRITCCSQIHIGDNLPKENINYVEINSLKSISNTGSTCSLYIQSIKKMK